MEKTRTENVAKNVVLSTIFQVIAFVVGFISRTIFIKILGEEYLGINGLFTNMLTLLSFAELGMGTAIIYSMYKPLAKKDYNKLKELTEFYRKAYLIIGIVVLVAGSAMIPFLNFFVKEPPNIKENLIIIYMLFVCNSAISYFFSYRTAIINADQKSYLIVIWHKFLHIIQVIAQIIVILLTHNYYLYLLMHLLTTLSANLILASKSKKMYPELKKTKGSKLPKKEKDGIVKNVKALFLYQVGGVALNGTDNIIISKYIGLAVTGIYSNYQMLISAITEVIGQVTNSFTGSIGNLNSVETKERKEEVFYKILYFTYVLFGVFSISIMLIINDFVKIWIGEKFLLDFFTISMIVGHFYVNGVQYASFSYRNTLGLFNEAKWGPILATIINIVLSIIFAKTIGLAGVFLATILARFFSYGLIDPIVVYRNEFKKSPIIYFGKYFKYFCFLIISFCITWFVVKFIPAYNIILIIIKGIVTVIISFILLVLPTIRTKEFYGIKYNFASIFNKLLHRR